jgi:hypothetical protein
MDRESNVANIALGRKVNAAASPLSTLTAWQVCLIQNPRDCFFSLRAERSNSGEKRPPWIAAGLAALAMTPGTDQPAPV